MHPCLRAAVVSVLSLVAGPAHAQWSTDAATNTVIASGVGEQVLPKVATTADGSTYVGWFDNGPGSYTVRLSRLDAAGNAVWGPSGILISANPQSTSLVDWDLIADSSGHCVLTFTDTRSGGDLDVFAYRVDADGNQLWGSNGVQLSNNADYEPSPRVTETTTGDFVFVWARLPNSGDGRIHMQRLDPAGAVQLAAGGQQIIGAAGESPAFCDVIASDGGDVIISWIRSIKTFASPRHLRARRFTSAGTSPWAAHVNVFDALSLPIGYDPILKPDGQGGAMLCWHRSELSGIYNSFVQRVSSSGAEVFPHNGVAVATSTASNHLDPALAYDEASGDSFVFWNERNSAQSQWGIHGQRIDATGTRQWGANGIAFAPLNTTYKFLPRAVPYADGAIVAYGDEPGGLFGKDRALAFRVDQAGALIGSATPIVIASTLSTKSRLPTVIDCVGNVRAVWEDDRTGTPDLYAQAFNPDLTLGASPSPWTNLGNALAGTPGLPSLTADGNLRAGTPVTLHLANMAQNSNFALIIGAFQANLPLLGGVLVPSPNLVVAGLPTGPTGALDLTGTWPVGVPNGASLYFQVWIVDAGGVAGAAATNGLRATVP
ncbi:MAG: hypothetical protein IPH13_18335 [Planctomycetes bacterium]|nr:hypothetical protein [Planctomycetota bacterium]